MLFIQDYLPPSKFQTISLVGGAWTLFMEVIWYVIFAALFAWQLNKKYNGIMIAANLALLAFTLATVYMGSKLPAGRVLMVFCCFTGLYIFRYFSRDISTKHFTWMMLLTCINVYSTLYVGFGIFHNPGYSIICIFNSYTAAFLLFWLFYATQNVNLPVIQPILNFLGKISYSLYLVHGLVIHLLTGNIEKSTTSTLLAIILSTAAGYLFYNGIEKHAMRIGKKIIKSMQAKTNSSHTPPVPMVTEAVATVEHKKQLSQ
ncbi:acyltransferase family protein [Deminuibacter soli]|uniref:Acyltransferase n=1 Tax=Deminuibacter soli TaxID=2291815 RepID=A0A3E1NI94_9BACT|nr:acyltransferase family protein [Deminuibacter soli]RFM27665.1 acyltransferase [Deminuibacter soli]